MIRSILQCGIVAIVFAFSVAPAFGDEKADDAKAMTGTWEIAKATLKGEDSTDIFKGAVLTVADGKYTFDFTGQIDKGTIALDPSKKPKRMTIEGTEGTNKGKTIPAIYEIGGDTVRICYELEGKEAPTAFESKAGSNTLLVTYKRMKK
jgi:uncharacterized protein (TIGR03067 family)